MSPSHPAGAQFAGEKLRSKVTQDGTLHTLKPWPDTRPGKPGAGQLGLIIEPSGQDDTSKDGVKVIPLGRAAIVLQFWWCSVSDEPSQFGVLGPL